MNLDACTPEQRRSIQHVDGPLLVSAGAGSGKTFTLTQRIAYALLPESGPAVSGIDEVLAITFTEKAASEIRARVKRTLRAEGLADEALLVDGAWISTIHGMCSRILHAHALELGLDPAFGIVSEEERAGMISLALDEALSSGNEIVGGGAHERLLREYGARQAGSFGTSVLSLATALINRASGMRGGLAAVAPAAPAADAGMLARELLLAFEEVLPVLEGEKDSATCCKARAAAREGVRAMQDALACPGGVGLAQLAGALESIPWIGKNFGSRETKERVAELNQVRARVSCEVLLGLARPLQDELVELARDVAARYERKKAESRKLDNDDLLSLALRALEENPEIAQRYEGRFKLVMIDEFQDTSQLQVDLIAHLAGDRAQNLCTVGDAQQSIYRFRGADVAVYERHRVQMRSPEVGALYVEMNRNFRSHRSVLSLVDRIFAQPCMFGERFMSLAPHDGRASSWKGDVPRIDMLLALQPADGRRGVTVADVRRAVARAIAQRFAHLKECGHAEGDMVVLLRRMTHAAVYADALREAGLSCVVAGGSRFADAPEVRIVARALQALANPASTDALFEVLSGELFGLSADDFLQLGTAVDERGARYVRRGIDVGFAALRGSSEASARLAFAERTFARACQRLRTSPPSDAVRLLAVESGWLTRLEGEGAEGLARAANVLKALRLVEDVEAQGACGIAEVSRAFSSLVDAGMKQSPGALSGAAGSAVRILTVHTSKGLEFPIVAVAEFDGARQASSALVTGCAEGSLRLSLALGATAKRFSNVEKRAKGWLRELDEDEARAVPPTTRAGERLALELREAAEERAEACRLLYVALTRASEALVVAMTGKEPSKGADMPTYAPLTDAIRSALCGAGDFPQGEATLDIGAGELARFQRFVVEPAADATGADAGAGTGATGALAGADAPGAPAGAGQATGCEPAPFVAPNLLPLRFEGVAATPRRQAGFFSYTSLSAADASDAVGAAGAPMVAGSPSAEGLADALAKPDEPAAPAGPAAAGALAAATAPTAPAAAGATGEATRLGSAFHRAAQFAIETGSVPDERRIDALARTYGLLGDQVRRLRDACGRWFGSDAFAEALAWPRRRAEVPFVVRMDAGSCGRTGAPASAREAFLEGEIDLLCTDADSAATGGGDAAASAQGAAASDGRGPRAFVVDYKTGGADDERPEALRAKHELQASCYAYALLRYGYGSVELCFARVERDDGAGQPQTVRYRFAASDLPALERTIRTLYQERLAE